MNAELKNSAESILSKLGITAEQALNIYYNQIILNNGLPFEIKLPDNCEYTFSDEIIESVLEGEKELVNGDYKTYDNIRDAVRDAINEV